LIGDSGEEIQASGSFEEAVEFVLSYRETLEHHAKAPIKEWVGGRDPKDGVMTWPYPKYHAGIDDFFIAIAELLRLWTPVASDYLEISDKFQSDHNAVAMARPDEVKALLTFAFSGERFCYGFWGAQLQSGFVNVLLNRLDKLYQSGEINRSTDLYPVTAFETD